MHNGTPVTRKGLLVVVVVIEGGRYFNIVHVVDMYACPTASFRPRGGSTSKAAPLVAAHLPLHLSLGHCQRTPLVCCEQRVLLGHELGVQHAI